MASRSYIPELGGMNIAETIPKARSCACILGIQTITLGERQRLSWGQRTPFWKNLHLFPPYASVSGALALSRAVVCQATQC